MKIIRNLLVLFFLVASFTACSSVTSEHTVMTYNIRHGLGMDQVLDLKRTAQVIQSANPDIVILNEVDHGTKRAFGILQTDSLGKQLKMNARFGRSIDYDGGEYGNALLSKYPILNFKVIDLSTDSLLEGRSVFLAILDLGADTLIVMGTHLGLIPAERSKQIDLIIQTLPKSPKLILAGDFNFESNSNSYQKLSFHLQDGILKNHPDPEFTFPADKPDRRIDYIFIGSKIHAKRSILPTSPELNTASDHLPQVLHFQVK